VVFRGDGGLMNLDVNRKTTWPLTRPDFHPFITQRTFGICGGLAADSKPE
jgi:hypothetical protein